VTSPARSPAPPPLRVLLCDDTAELRALTRSVLDRHPALCVVGEAGDGAEAIALAARELPDVLVLDLDMPGPRPAELVSAIAAVAPDTAIVTFSGYDPARLAGAAASRVAVHVPKTTDLALLAQAVADVGSVRPAA
jgi:DNA-binding NarL/FixJ family response regulator